MASSQRKGSRSAPELPDTRSPAHRARVRVLRTGVAGGDEPARTLLDLSGEEATPPVHVVEALIGLRAESWNRLQLGGTQLVTGRRRIATWQRRSGVVLTDGEVVEFVVREPEAAVHEFAALLTDGAPSH